MTTAPAELAPLILGGTGYELQVAPEAEAQKAELLKHSALIVEVNDNAAADAARNQLKKLASMRNLVEKSRKGIKEPVLAIGRDIDTRAKEFLTEIEAEEKRVSGLIAAHAAEIERQRQAAERERLRLEREAQQAREKAEREAREAEARRIKAEQEAEAARLKAEQEAAQADGDDIDAQIEAARKIDEANAAQKKAEEKARAAREAERRRQIEAEQLAAQAQQQSLLANTTATSGVKFELDFEVEDLHALYAAQPTFVTLTVRTADVKAWLKTQPEGVTVPGLRIIKKPVVSTR